MAPNLPEKLLGISIDDPGVTTPEPADDDEEELVRFVFFTIGEHRLAIAVDDVKTITEPPADPTRVPRSAPAVEGLTDLRGEITAVIDPRVHFPVETDPSESQRLLVFDRPAERQPAAIRVDEVLGVETVSEHDVREDEDVDERDVAGGAIEHPLVGALVERERTPTGSERRSRSNPAGADDAARAEGGVASRLERMGTGDRRDGEEFVPNAAEETDADGDDRPGGPAVVELTPLVDVDRLLRASGTDE